MQPLRPMDFLSSKGYAVSPLPIQRKEPSTDSHNRDYLLNYWKGGATIADRFWCQNKQYQVVDPNIELEDDEDEELSIRSRFGGRKQCQRAKSRLITSSVILFTTSRVGSIARMAKL
uniref:Bm9741 n=1 Tax=Brugia malayi TaxID=6279 RepID=A0A0J9XUE0_BRUMA|nr:Bm9741 [Brugia malayi]